MPELQVRETAVDLTACDNEAIQFSNAIQPFGVLVAVQLPDLIISEASVNCAEVLNKPIDELLNSGLASCLPSDQAEWLMGRLTDSEIGMVPVHLGPLFIGGREYPLFAHRVGNKLILELEREPSCEGTFPQTSPRSSGLYAEVQACIAEMVLTPGIPGMLAVATRAIRRLTGFDRVLVHQYLDDGTGQIRAEAKREELASFMGLHFPAGDVPLPARRILSLVWVRHQPDTGYVPVAIKSWDPLATPLDLSYSMLRSTSANCNKYYQNLGVRSKLVIALLDEGEPWGFASCQQATVKHVSHEVRMACETIAHTVSLLLSDKEKAANAQSHLKVRQDVEAIIARLAESPLRAESLADGLTALMPCGGAAALIDGELMLRGETPKSFQVADLMRWLDERAGSAAKPVLATRCLWQEFPAARVYRGVASGVLAVRLGNADYLVWFRPEIDYEISWAGDPAKPVEIDERDGQLKVGPRKSFEMIRTGLKGISEPWQAYEVEGAAALSRAVEAMRVSARLSESKDELKSFAHTAAHDLREPLRGILMYSQMLSADLRQNISETEYGRLETIQRLGNRMETLLQSLLECAVAEQGTHVVDNVDLNVLLGQAIETVAHQISSGGATVRAASQLPTVRCDAVQVQQLLVNLIMNGLKYNDRPDKLVEVGFLEGMERTFYVRDNGIGIDPKHHKDVFTIFRRLHGRTEYGGGSGAGLSIVSKIVQHHGGKVWVESSPGAGSTFFFTLPAAGTKQKLPAGMA